MGVNKLDHDTFGPSVAARYAPGLVSQGIAAELVAAKWKLSREQLDALSAESHRRADETSRSGGFAREIVPITTPDGTVVSVDESIRPGTTTEKLGGLKPALEDAAMHERFPQIQWSVTAGNSSQITDGASAMLIMTAAKAEELGLRPRARIHAMSVLGDDPLYMLTAPIPATERALSRSGLTASDIDHFEVNEAFASVPLAWQASFDVDPARLNPRGGAIALGHPLGASGCRLMTTMIYGLEDTGGRYGLQTMCEAGGMANATIIERLG
jgi:acetyl-CoA acetyltransferase family protein